MNNPSAKIKPDDDPLLSELQSVEELSNYLHKLRDDIQSRAKSGVPGLALAREYSDIVDALVRRMLMIAALRAGRSGDMSSIPIAVVATGGYGRRELCPHSDIDITFIPYRDGDRQIDRIVKEMFNLVVRIFIDSNAMEVGYAYRLLEDCSSLDHQTISGLMDGRLVAGSNRIFIVFENDFWLHYNPAEYIFTKLEERKQARAKFGDTPRLIEPNIKEGPGGMRDLHTAVWLTQARKNLTAADVRGERIWEALGRESEVTPSEIHRLREAKEFLFRVRNALHAITGAERDELVVTRQEEVATALGYDRAVLPTDIPSVEHFMQDYYIHASNIFRISRDIIHRAENSRIFLGIGLDCKRRQIVPANTALGMEDPIWMLWACELAQKYELEISDALERDILELLDKQPRISDMKQTAEIFERILASPRGAYSILQLMADMGILNWVLPEMDGIMNLISYDPSHDYTVGQHTLYVVRTLDALRCSEGPEDTRDFRQIMAEIPHIEQLYLAALLHDAGKNNHEKPHSETGAELAKIVCQRLGWDETATANVCFLVRYHLLMAETSRLRDLNLEETIRDFTSIVDDLDRLHMLYLLTYADTCSVAPGVWTQLKGKFLRDLLHRAERSLVGEDAEDYSDITLTRARRRLMKELSVENLPPDEVSEHVENMPATYILNADLNDIALHIGFMRRARQGDPVIDFHDERNATFTLVTVCTLDDPRPGLLAKITGVFYASDVNVHSAQIFTRVAANERIAIDSFYVDFRGRQLTPGKRKEIGNNLKAVLKGELSVEILLQKRKKSASIGGPVEKLIVRNDLADNYTVVEVTAPDDRSFFYRICGALSSLGWNIHSAKVSLFRGRSVASYYISGTNGISDIEARHAAMKVMPTAE
jgi:[protein-PII] uridylyltransferase